MIVWSRHSRKYHSETSWSYYPNALELVLADPLTLEYYQLLWRTFDPMQELEMAPQSTLRPARLRMQTDYELQYLVSRHDKWMRLGNLTSSMQNSEAALMKVAGTTTQWQSSHSTTGNPRCHSTKIRDVNRVYESGMGVRIRRSHTLMLSLNCERFWSCTQNTKPFSIPSVKMAVLEGLSFCKKRGWYCRGQWYYAEAMGAP